MNAESETIEDNVNAVNAIVTNETLFEFAFLSIEKLEVIPENYLVLESYLKRDFLRKIFFINFDHLVLDQKHAQSIENLFEENDSMATIQIKFRQNFHWRHKMLWHKILR